MHGDLAGDGPGLAGERVHGGRVAQTRLWRLLGPARGSPGGVGGDVWSARGRAPRHLVSRPPRPPWWVGGGRGGGGGWGGWGGFVFRPGGGGPPRASDFAGAAPALACGANA